MQFSTFTLAAILGAASTVLAQSAVVLSYPNGNCAGGQTTASAGLNKGSSVSCAVTLPPNSGGSSAVVGSGCRTYFYVDSKCSANYFGNGNTVPDSKCYFGIGSYAVYC